MRTPPEQSFTKHAKMVPGYHYLTFACLLAFMVWSIWQAASTKQVGPHFEMLGAFAMFGLFYYVRAFPLRARDRIIRLEEQLRLMHLLPEDLRRRIPELSPRQLIALRFASDGEVPELVRWVLTERITDAKAIKQRITSWRPDHFRL